MKNYKYLYIKSDSNLYNQVIEMRYKVFFKPFKCSMDTVFDVLEKESIHLVCCYKNIVVGYGRLNIIRKIAQISQLVVKEEHRKKGIGYKIMEELTYKSRDLEIEKAILNAKIEAVSLYRKLGYKTIGEEFPSIKTGLPHIRMEKILGNV